MNWFCEYMSEDKKERNDRLVSESNGQLSLLDSAF